MVIDLSMQENRFEVDYDAYNKKYGIITTF